MVHPVLYERFTIHAIQYHIDPYSRSYRMMCVSTMSTFSLPSQEHIFRALQEEAEARKLECTPPCKRPGRFYDRQMAWLRQREIDLEALRDSEAPRQRRPSSAPVTPRANSGQAILEKLRSARPFEMIEMYSVQ